MRILYEINEKMEDELKLICRKDEISDEDVDLIGKMVDVIKDITTIEAMKNPEKYGWSNDYDDDYSMATYRMPRISRDMEGASYRRGRDAMGRYTSYDDEYSRHSKEEMIEHLKEMMLKARTPEERESYRSVIEQMSR